MQFISACNKDTDKVSVECGEKNPVILVAGRVD